MRIPHRILINCCLDFVVVHLKLRTIWDQRLNSVHEKAFYVDETFAAYIFGLLKHVQFVLFAEIWHIIIVNIWHIFTINRGVRSLLLQPFCSLFQAGDLKVLFEDLHHVCELLAQVLVLVHKRYHLVLKCTVPSIDQASGIEGFHDRIDSVVTTLANFEVPVLPFFHWHNWIVVQRSCLLFTSDLIATIDND